MKKNNFIITLALVMVLAFSLLLTGCQYEYPEYEIFDNGTFKPHKLYMNASETLTVNHSTLKGVSHDMDKFDSVELFVYTESHDGVVTIKDNVITAANSGYTTIAVTIYRRGRNDLGQRVTFKMTIILAEIHVVNEATMIPITTAQELAGMKNGLDGHYILKSDIDLADWGEWEPIGNSPASTVGPFTGSFVNRGGYTIKNLTISTPKLFAVGFFGRAQNAYFEGLKLTNVNIDCPAKGENGYYAGGLFGSVDKSIIKDCSVEGSITAKYQAGGITGGNWAGFFWNCHFEGTLRSLRHQENFMDARAGGITSSCLNYTEFIGCSVQAVIYSEYIGGGIIGTIYDGSNPKIQDCLFEGEIYAPISGEIYAKIWVYKPPAN